MERQKILVVDDSEFNRRLLVAVLEDEYDTVEAENGKEALAYINSNPASVSLILMDILMPEMTGLEVMKILNETGISALIPVILITASESQEEYGLNLGAVDFITKPFDPNIVKTRVRNLIKIKNTRDLLEDLVAFNMNSLEHAWDATIEMLANVIEFRSLEYFKNYDRIKKITKILVEKLIEEHVYSVEIAEMGLNSILSASTLCDLGKIFVPDSIIKKKGALTEKEYEIVKKHTIQGKLLVSKCLSSVSPRYTKCCEEVCLSHHEYWDGTGYPNKLKGEEIPVSARIVAVTDVFDALVTGRPYRRAYSSVEALQIMDESSGKQFDPVIVDVFMKVADKICAVYDKDN